MKDVNHNSSHSPVRGIKNFFSQEPLWKIFSLIVAIFMWFVVMNTINPTEIKTFSASVSLDNMEELNSKGYVVSNLSDFENLSISIKVEGTRPALDELSKSAAKNNIKAKIDLAKIDVTNDQTFPKTYSVIIAPSLPGNSYMYSYDITSYYPTVAEVIIDQAGSKTVPVELKTYGSPLSGYVADKAESEVSEVTVTGPLSEVSKVEKAVATIDITNASAMVEKSCTMTVYDDTDTILESFVVSPSQIPVSVNIKKSSTLKINEPNTKGALPGHLELTSIDWSPKSINVISDSPNIPESINLPDVDLTAINKETTISVDIRDTLKKFNAEAENSKETTVKITVNVGVKSAEEYSIPSNIINVTGLAPILNVTMPDNVKIEVGGVENIDVYTLAPTVDVTGLGEGKYTLPLKLNLPPNATLKEDAEITVEITNKSEENNDPPVNSETPETENTTIPPEETSTTAS